MTVTISPTVAAINAQDKPYTASFSGLLDFVPESYEWYVGGHLRLIGSIYTDLGAGAYSIPGPVYTFCHLPAVVLLRVKTGAGVFQQATYTTANQCPAPDTSITLLAQRDGVPIVDGVSVPTTPLASAVAGESKVDVLWTYGVVGASPQSRVSISVVASNKSDLVDTISVDWGDGNTDVFDQNAVTDAEQSARHTYTGVTGALTITASQHDPDGVLVDSDTRAIIIPADATGFYAQQYRIIQYQDQAGFREVCPVGWRPIVSAEQAIRLYNMRRGHQYHYMLQLREVDTTGRPVRTTLRSAESLVGPW